mgnify:CR=1 FL=1
MMKALTPTEKLDYAIAVLEQRQATELQDVKNQFNRLIDAAKPINIIKNTLEDFRNIPNAKSSIIASITGIAAGYVSRKLLVDDSSSSLLKKISGYAIQFAITNFISKKIN